MCDFLCLMGHAFCCSKANTKRPNVIVLRKTRFKMYLVKSTLGQKKSIARIFIDTASYGDSKSHDEAVF